MNLARVIEAIRAEVITGEERVSEVEIETVCAGDLMSDVLAFSKPGSLLVTGLINPQSVRTAEMSEVRAICFVRGKTPPAETIELARRAEIPLLRTSYSTYVVSGILFATGLMGCDGSI